MRRKIFVFGSNLAGIHGAGSALAAKKHYGAVQGQGEGLHGNSYAIPTKDRMLQSLRLADIECHVSNFVLFATRHPEMQFNVVAIGCGLAGFRPDDIAPFFKDAPGNVFLPTSFEQVLDRQPSLM
jgi:hypothetical protein